MHNIVSPKYALPDQELLELVAEGDHRAFNAIYDRYSGLLYLHAFNLTRDDQLAQDIVQDILASLWEKKGLVLQNNDLLGYLYQALRYRFFNLLDRQKVRDAYCDRFEKFAAQQSFITDEQVRENELRRLIEHAVNNLPPKMREVFIISQQHNLSYKEIASQLNISDKTVKKQLDNARKVLRLKLGNLFLFSVTFFTALIRS